MIFILVRNAWSRVNQPVIKIGDLSEKEAKEFLIKKCTIKKRRNNIKKKCEEKSRVYLIKRCNKEIVKKECIINDEQVNELYKLVGGRILLLNAVAEKFLDGLSLEGKVIFIIFASNEFIQLCFSLAFFL